MIEPIITLLIGVVLILAIIAANGYFVAQEFAFMSVDRTRLAARAAEGDVAARHYRDGPARRVCGRTARW
jgi:CBS domain containing-hemolysin-like protein